MKLLLNVSEGWKKKENFNMIPECLICNRPMQLVKSIKPKKGTQYRKRRFHCDLCSYSTTIYADGVMDLKLIPDQAVEDAKKQNKLQHKNPK